MIILNSLLRLCRRLDRVAADRLTQQQLRRLDAHLLRDIGFTCAGGRIVPLAGTVHEPLARPPVAEPVAAVEATGVPEPQADGG